MMAGQFGPIRRDATIADLETGKELSGRFSMGAALPWATRVAEEHRDTVRVAVVKLRSPTDPSVHAYEAVTAELNARPGMGARDQDRYSCRRLRS